MLTPRPYQTEAIHTGLRKNLLIADECGLGKTLTAIEAAKILVAEYNRPALIVCTKTIKAQWIKALKAQGVPEAMIVSCDAKGLERAPEACSFILVHYEALVKHCATLQALGGFSVIVADEAHKIKNRKAQRSEAIKKLKSFRRIALTGTPWDRNPADAWSIFNWLDPQFFSSYWRFFEAHINYRERVVNRAGTKVKEIDPVRPLKAPERFARTLRQFMIRRYKAEVREDLPERIDQFIEIEMAPDQARAYRKLEAANDVLTDLGDGVEIAVPIVLTHILRLMQLTTDPALLGLKASSAKLDWLTDWLEENKDQSFIVFTRFRETALKVSALFESLGLAHKLIIGGTKREEVTEQDRAIVGTIAAMGEGLDLPHIDYAIFLDCEWSSIMMQQAIDRIHRINITNVKHVMYLQCIDTVDQLVHETIINKWSTQALAHKYIEGRG